MKSEVQPIAEKEEIRALIPHAGAMCLLDSVLEWDERSILCTSDTHRDTANPLRREGRLSAVHAFEYGAQAVAVHGGLCARAASTVAPPGYLAALRDASLRVEDLDHLTSPLRITAERLFADRANSVYQCSISAGDDITLAEGRVTIILRSPPTKEMKDNVRDSFLNAREYNTEAQVERAIPADHPSLPGHFPGGPIVPGVSILDEVIATLRENRRCQINRINLAKFLSPLLPEQTFTISFAATHSGQVNFECRVEDRRIVEGCLEISHP